MGARLEIEELRESTRAVNQSESDCELSETFKFFFEIIDVIPTQQRISEADFKTVFATCKILFRLGNFFIINRCKVWCVLES